MLAWVLTPWHFDKDGGWTHPALDFTLYPVGTAVLEELSSTLEKAA